MPTRTLLVTGSSGVLGWRLVNYFRRRGFVVTGTFRRHEPFCPGVSFLRMDLDDPASVREVLARTRPDLLVHCAALTRPDECEENRARAYRVNVEATAEIVDRLPPASLLVYISTDLVFNGEKGNYREGDSEGPINYYGETKLVAEEKVRSRENAAVCRVAKLYSLGSPFHPCFLTWMRDRFEGGEKVPLFTDQWRTPVHVDDVARALEHLFAGSFEWNLYHLGGPERLTRYAFGREFARVFGYREDLIEPTRLADVDLAPRGKDCSLDSSRFQREFHFQPVGTREGLESLLKEKN